MAELEAAPPNTKPGGNAEALRGGVGDNAMTPDDVVAYQRDVPKWKRIKDHSLTQMLLMSVQSFCGPAMADAIAGLGGGGLATPQTSNIAAFCSATGSMSFPIRGSSYYCNSKYGNQWIAPANARGKYLALWIVARNTGQLIGGALNLAKNHTAGKTGGIDPQTYIAFLIIESLAFPFAWLISPMHDVVRSDGTRVRVGDKLSAWDEFRRIKVTFSSKLLLLSAPWAFWSFFYGGTWSTYLATYFSVRSRALSSLISPFFCIVGCFGLGFILDIKHLSQRRRAQLGMFTVVALNLGVYVWSIVMQTRFNKHHPGKIDWVDDLYPSAFLPYFFVQTTGPLSQSYMYWLISSFGTDAQANVRNGAAFRCIEAIGSAVAYGMNTQTKTSPIIGMCVTFGLMGLCIVPMTLLVNQTPDRIPAEVLEEGAAGVEAPADQAQTGVDEKGPGEAVVVLVR
ncbi:hypothetical protein IAU60_001919 [Kwoniella sp. DSM 27419]